MSSLVSLRTRALIFSDRDELLLVKTNHNQTWSAPGGTAEPGETIQAALLRETEEEVGVEIEVGRLVIVHDLLETSTTEQRVNFWFECRTFQTPPAGWKDPDGKIEDLRFFSQADLQDFPEKVFPAWQRDELWQWRAAGFTNHTLYQPEVYDVFPFRQGN